LHDGLKIVTKDSLKGHHFDSLYVNGCAWFWFVLIFYLSFNDLEGIVHFRFNYFLCIELLVHSK
jgi:hypothetical protein